MRNTILITVAGVVLCIVVSETFAAVMFAGDAYDVQMRVVISVIVLCSVLGLPLFLFISLKIRQLRSVNRKLRYLADYDGLTGLLNRRAFIQRFDASSTALSQAPGALLLIDIDNFKAVNDRWGHATGDAVLQQVASALALAVNSMPGCSLLGRLGGEEFAVWVPDANRPTARGYAERLRDVVETRAVTVCGTVIRLTISVGVALAEVSEPFEKLYPTADTNLYSAKLQGRNCVVS